MQLRKVRHSERGCLQRVEDRHALERGATPRRVVDGHGRDLQGLVHFEEVGLLQGQAKRVHRVRREDLKWCLGHWDVLHDV